MESAYGHGIGDVFLYAAPVALLAFLVLFIKEVPLKTQSAIEQGGAAVPDGGSSPSRRAGTPRPLRPECRTRFSSRGFSTRLSRKDIRAGAWPRRRPR